MEKKENLQNSNYKQKQKEEVEKNFEYFNQNYDDILNRYSNKKYVLLKSQKIVGAFDSWEDVKETAGILYKDNENYSIQEVIPKEINLGYQSYALY